MHMWDNNPRGDQQATYKKVCRSTIVAFRIHARASYRCNDARGSRAGRLHRQRSPHRGRRCVRWAGFRRCGGERGGSRQDRRRRGQVRLGKVQLACVLRLHEYNSMKTKPSQTTTHANIRYSYEYKTSQLPRACNRDQQGTYMSISLSTSKINKITISISLSTLKIKKTAMSISLST